MGKFVSLGALIVMGLIVAAVAQTSECGEGEEDNCDAHGRRLAI